MYALLQMISRGDLDNTQEVTILAISDDADELKNQMVSHIKKSILPSAKDIKNMTDAEKDEYVSEYLDDSSYVTWYEKSDDTLSWVDDYGNDSERYTYAVREIGTTCTINDIELNDKGHTLHLLKK